MKELASIAHRDESWVSNLERGKIGLQPSYDVIVAWARMLGVTADQLVLGGPDDAPPPEEPIAQVLNRIGAWLHDERAAIRHDQAGSGGRGTYIEEGEGGPLVGRSRRMQSRQLYVIRLEGDCLVPEARTGDLVVFDPERPAEPDDLVVAVDGEQVFVKYLKVDQAVQYLMPLIGESIPFTPGMRIVGVVHHFERRPRRAPRLRRKKDQDAPTTIDGDSGH